MCENCGCHTAEPSPKTGKTKDAKPGEWHVHADGTAHRHGHGHDHHDGHDHAHGHGHAHSHDGDHVHDRPSREK